VRVLVQCLADPASVRIGQHLQRALPWREAGRFEGRPVLAHADWRLVTTEPLHISDERLDDRLAAAGFPPDELVFLSKHRSESAKPTLTVHPIGNWHEARYGGRAATVSPCAPALMTGLLAALTARAPPGYEVSFEATHHGPETSVPTVFVEVGSSEAQWADDAAAAAVVAALLEHAPSPAPPVLCIGGGHYAPRFTDAARRGAIAVGHILPDHAAAAVAPDTLEAAVRRIPGFAGIALDPRASPAALRCAAALQEEGAAAVPLRPNGAPGTIK